MEIMFVSLPHYYIDEEFETFDIVLWDRINGQIIRKTFSKSLADSMVETLVSGESCDTPRIYFKNLMFEWVYSLQFEICKRNGCNNNMTEAINSTTFR